MSKILSKKNQPLGLGLTFKGEENACFLSGNGGVQQNLMKQSQSCAGNEDRLTEHKESMKKL